MYWEIVREEDGEAELTQSMAREIVREEDGEAELMQSMARE